MKKVHDGVGAKKREWGDADQATLDRVARLEIALGAAPPSRPGKTFAELRVSLGEPDATDGEIHQAALDAGLVVED